MVRNCWLGCRIRRMAYSYGLRKAAPPNTLTDRAPISVRSWALKIKSAAPLPQRQGVKPWKARLLRDVALNAALFDR